MKKKEQTKQNKSNSQKIESLNQMVEYLKTPLLEKKENIQKQKKI